MKPGNPVQGRMEGANSGGIPRDEGKSYGAITPEMQGFFVASTMFGVLSLSKSVSKNIEEDE